MNAKKKRTYGGVIAAGLLALLVDRMFLSEPETVTAVPLQSARRTPAPNPQEQENGAQEAISATVAAAGFPRDLPKPDASDELRDAFTMTAATRAALMGWPAPAGTRDGADATVTRMRGSTIEEFKQNHTLSAVISGGQVEIAVVDGHRMKIGDLVDGCKLDVITGQSALFACPEGVAVLTVFGTEIGEGD
ncbi:MAG: hypothetical protein GY778_21300 [bacterium]|nr:hypothetical protein [bacterium]